MSEKSGFNIIKAQYMASAVRLDQYPEGDWGEIAFIGRSNVGKSSLINSLCRHNGLARISGTPGKTQTLNFYSMTAKLNEQDRLEFLLVDLPGYGYARRGQADRRQWAKFIEEYLLQSPRLQLVMQLIDSRHPPFESDISSYRWLIEHDVPVQVVATKADKLTRMNVKRQTDLIAQAIGLQDRSVICYSTLKSMGRDELLDVIGQILIK